MDMTFDQYYGCDHFGVVTSYVDRVNDVPIYLARFGVIDLITYLRVDEKMKAFLYWANLLDIKRPIRVVEIYYDWYPHSTGWRRRGAQFALRIDDDLADGLDDDVAITDSVIPVAITAMEEIMFNH